MPQPASIRYRSITLASAIASLVSGYAHAGPAPFMDARAFAMGGTGVASARSVSASMVNPALLSLPHGEHQDGFGLLFPSINARAATSDNLKDDVNKFRDGSYWDNFDNAVQAFNNNPSTVTLNNLIDRANTLNQELQSVDKDSFRVDAGVAIAAAMPSPQLGFGVFADSTIQASAVVNYVDAARINNYIQTAQDILNGSVVGSLPNVNDVVNGLQSNGEGVGVAFSETGIALSHIQNINGHDIAFGVAPKVLRVDTFDYLATVNNFNNNDFHPSDYKTSKTGFNLDLGVASQFGTNSEWTAGLSIKNLLPMTVKTVRDRDIKVKPKMRAGVAYQLERATFAADLDLTKNDKFGLESATQFLSLGAEYDLAHWVQVRGGIRQNLASDNAATDSIKEATQFTAGLGFTPFGMLIDIAGEVSSKDYGASLQLGAMF